MKKEIKKILIIRFSSMGDILLTTPIIRALKNKFQDSEIHFVVKSSFVETVVNNPHITKIHILDNNESELISELKKEDFDTIIDLHKSIRSLKFRALLGKKSYSFPKLNFKKWLFVKFKINRLPQIHIVDRYFKAVEKLNVENDQKGLEFVIPNDTNLPQDLNSFLDKNTVVIAVGSKHSTKQIPVGKIEELIKFGIKKLVLLGGKDDAEKAEKIRKLSPETIYNACGKLSLTESALALTKSKALVTGDTGLMHLASALDVKIISIWGNTSPHFGMYPYLPNKKEMFYIFEIEELKCRPCSKLGFETCPKKHFKCMLDHDMEEIAEIIERF